jgi:hypothetical protein
MGQVSLPVQSENGDQVTGQAVALVPPNFYNQPERRKPMYSAVQIAAMPVRMAG